MSLSSLDHGLHQMILVVTTFLKHKQKFPRARYSCVEIENSIEFLFFPSSRSLKEASVIKRFFFGGGEDGTVSLSFQ